MTCVSKHGIEPVAGKVKSPLSGRTWTYIKVLVIVSLLSFSSFAQKVLAHQPRVVMDAMTSEANPIDIESPEDPKAFYGQLKDAPDYYRIVSDRPFHLYVDMMVANNTEGRSGRFNADVINATGLPKNVIIILNGYYYGNWTQTYDPMGRETYLVGPQVSRTLGPGTYLIRIYNSQNSGKYVLSVGDGNVFPLKEAIDEALAIPQVEIQFFGKPLLEAFFNISGLLIVGMIVVASVLAKLIMVFTKSLRSNIKMR
jgi:hypothetical protein